MGSTLLLSYSFIWQPAYDTPRSEIMTDNTKVIFENTPENTYLSLDKAGNYYIVVEECKIFDEIAYEEAQMMIESGFCVENID